MKTITINNEVFELEKPMTKLDLPACSFKSVDDVYGRPSDTKRRIFQSWFDWFRMNDGYCGVQSHNCNFFTIGGLVRDKDSGKEYYCYITYAHNRAYEIV